MTIDDVLARSADELREKVEAHTCILAWGHLAGHDASTGARC